MRLWQEIEEAQRRLRENVSLWDEQDKLVYKSSD